MSVAWGLMSTAPINERILEAARESDLVEIVAVGSRERGASRGLRLGSTEFRGRTGATTSCSTTPRSRRSTSPFRTGCMSSGRCARSRPASTRWSRSRSRATRTTSSASSAVAESAGRRRLGRLHVAPPSPDRQTRAAARGGGDRGAAAHPCRVQLPSRGRTERRRRPLQRRPRRGRDDGPRLLLRQRDSFPRRGSQQPGREAGGRSHRRRCHLRRDVHARRRRPLALRLQLCGAATVEARGARRRGKPVRDHAVRDHVSRIELRRDGDVEQVVVEQADSYRLELENISGAIRGEARLLLGREDAVAQARTIEALYESAACGTSWTPALRVDGVPTQRPERVPAAGDLTWPVAQLRPRSPTRDRPRDPPPRLRLRHHALRPRQ